MSWVEKRCVSSEETSFGLNFSFTKERQPITNLDRLQYGGAMTRHAMLSEKLPHQHGEY
jgi:hypothetical protein